MLSQQRTLAVVAVLALVVGGLAGYGGSRLAPGGDPSATAQKSYIQQFKEAGELRVGCADSPPTIVIDTNGKCTGPDLLPLQEIATLLGVEMVTVNTTWQNIIAGLQADQYDFAADLDPTGERNASIMFTAPSWSYSATFIVPQDTEYRTTEAILGSGKPICTNQGNASDAALKKINANTLLLNNYADCFLAVASSNAIAVFADIGTAQAFVSKQPDLRLIIPDPPIFVHNVAYGVRSDIDAHSLQMFDTTITNLVISGEMSRAFKAAGYLDETQMQTSGLLLQ